MTGPAFAELPAFTTGLAGQTAFVTGASSGLGRRFAWVLAAAGAKVVIAGRRRDRLEELAAQIAAAGGAAAPLVLDLADAAVIPAAIETAQARHGLIDILVNNAGVPDGQLATKMSLDFIDSVINTNLRAPFVLAAEVARRLIAAKQPGRIVNIASMNAFYCDAPGVALYATTKAALVRMTEALSVEWARFGINVNAIAPGAFASEMLDGMISRIGMDFVERFPRKRIGELHQLDSTLLYLVSKSSECVTGTCIKVDDGQTPR